MIALVVALAVALFAEGFGERRQGSAQLESLPEIPPHLIYVPMDVAARMLELANVTRNDIVYDLGCGDGRVAILAARKYRAKGVGLDVDPKRIAEAKGNAEREGVSTLVRFVEQNTVDLSEATVVTMSLPQSVRWLSLNGLLHPTLTKQLKPGARIVSNVVAGSMKDWKPDRVDRFTDASGKRRATLYLWKYDGRSGSSDRRSHPRAAETPRRRDQRYSLFSAPLRLGGASVWEASRHVISR
jgi:SAM-dependent methyltransferase